jgi:hypothetical protein
MLYEQMTPSAMASFYPLHIQWLMCTLSSIHTFWHHPFMLISHMMQNSNPVRDHSLFMTGGGLAKFN